jgi:hypothetical protein
MKQTRLFARTVATAALILTTATVAALPAVADPDSRTVQVNCAAGGRLGPALVLRAAALTVRFRGTCNERITIARDDVTLAGAAPGATIVGSVTLDGASRVRLADFTVRDTPGDDPFRFEGDGIRILASQKVTVERVRTEDTGRRGLSIEESSTDLIDVTVLRAGGAGIQAQASGLNVFGTLALTDGAGPGLLLVFQTHIFARRDARLVFDRNVIGVAVQGNATLTLSNEAWLQANDNLALGILITSQGDFFYGESRIVARGNGLGALVSEHSNWTPFVGSPAVVEIAGNTGGGVLLERGGFLEFGDGTAAVTGNGGPGFHVDDSRLVLRGTTAQGNAGSDVVLIARTSAIFGDSNVFGTPIACDGTVLVRGTAACGAAPPATAAARTPEGPQAADLVRRARALLGAH